LEREEKVDYKPRDEYLTHLNTPTNEDGSYDVTEERQAQRLLQLANAFQEKETFEINRFERLNMPNLLHYQHKLTKFDKLINVAKGKVSPKMVKDVRRTLFLYCEVTLMTGIKSIAYG
jgi:hypothetical protein